MELSGRYSLSGIPEDAADGAIASGYAEIRSRLGVPFVPTIYRILAQCEDAFTVAVGNLGRIADLAHELHVAADVQGRARDALIQHTCCHPEVARRPEALGRLLEDYAQANAVGLLFSIAVVGSPTRIFPGVMDASIPTSRAGSLRDDIVVCHGNVILPGFWKDLTAGYEGSEEMWTAVRSHAREGHFVRAREGVLSVTAELAPDGPITSTAVAVAPLLPDELREILGWFPTGISTMIVEVEWLRGALHGWRA